MISASLSLPTVPPSIDSLHDTTEETPTKSPNWKRWLGLGLLCLIALLLGVFFIGNTPSNKPEVSVQQTTKVAPKATTKLAARSPSPPDQTTKASQARRFDTRSETSASANEQKRKLSKKSTTTKKKTVSEDKTAIAELYKSKTKDTETTTTLNEVAQSKVIQNKENVFKDYENIRLIKNLPFSAQSTIPTLIYSGHHYRKSGSHIVINGKKIKTGQRVEGAIRVEKILADGIILKDNKNTFKMQALNSWLNYD